MVYIVPKPRLPYSCILFFCLAKPVCLAFGWKAINGRINNFSSIINFLYDLPPQGSPMETFWNPLLTPFFWHSLIAYFHRCRNFQFLHDKQMFLWSHQSERGCLILSAWSLSGTNQIQLTPLALVFGTGSIRFFPFGGLSFIQLCGGQQAASRIRHFETQKYCSFPPTRPT